MGPIDLGIPGLANIERIGAGGNAVVYRARQVALDRTVVVKVLTAADIEATRRRFDRERRAMGRLSQAPGIAPIYDSGVTASGQPWLLMPYYERGSLQDVIERQGPLPPGRVAEIGERIALAVHAAHEAGVLHRDLKPANILVSASGRPDVADFGIAHLPEDTLGVSQSLTMTPLYTAPEVFDGVDAGRAGDVYSLGALLFALINGRPAFANDDGSPSTVLALMRRIHESPVPELADHVPPGLRAAIRQAMSKEPGQRQASAEELARQLAGFDGNAPRMRQRRVARRRLAPAAGERALGKRTTSSSDQQTRSRLRRWLTAAAIIGVLLVAAVAGVVVLSGGGQGNTVVDNVEPTSTVTPGSDGGVVSPTTTVPTPETARGFDVEAVVATASPSTVLVEGFSCTGVEQAPGVVLADGRILTDESILVAPWLIGVTGDGVSAHAEPLTRDLNRKLGLVVVADAGFESATMAPVGDGDRVVLLAPGADPVEATIDGAGQTLGTDLPIAVAVGIEHATPLFNRDGAVVAVAGEADDDLRVLPISTLDDDWNRTPPRMGCPSLVRDIDATDAAAVAHPHLAEVLLLQRHSDALADGRWDDVRRYEPDKASLTDEVFEAGWGPLEQGFVYPVDRQALADGRARWRLGLIGHETWRGDALTTLFCVTWEVDPATGIVVQTNDDTIPVYGSQPDQTRRAGMIDPGELVVLIDANC